MQLTQAFLFAAYAVSAYSFQLVNQEAAYSAQLDQSLLDSQFNLFVTRYQRNYANEDEKTMRKAVFENNMKKIAKHNSEAPFLGTTWTMAPNQFTDMTAEEFSAHLGLFAIPEKKFEGLKQVNVATSIADLPQEVDWTTKNAVTSVKNQGHCGSCWSFSATGAVEGLWAITKGQLLAFSEQQLVDCSGSYGEHGCRGGLMDYAFNYIRDHGICTEEAYPYAARKHFVCKSNKCQKVKIDGYVDVEPNDKKALLSAIAQQPVSVAVAANDFQFYKSGVLQKCSTTALNHGVLAVGYSIDDDYIKIKNSWGSSWGEDGFIRLAIGNEYQGGSCGVMEMSSYPIISQ